MTTSPQSSPRSSRWPTILQVVVSPLMLAAALAVPSLLSLVPGVRRINDPSLPPWIGAAAVVVFSALVTTTAIVVVRLVARLDGRRTLADVGWTWNRRSLLPLLVGIAVSAVVLVGVGAPLTAAGLLRPDTDTVSAGPLWVAAVIGLAQAFLLQGIPEELIFRGYLLRSLRIRPVVAVVVSGLTFGAIHLVSQGGQQGWGERLAYLALPAGFGLAAGALVLSTRSLWAAVGVHGGLHATTLVSELLASRGSPLVLGDGPALWLASGLAYTLLAVALLIRYARSRRRDADTAGV